MLTSKTAFAAPLLQPVPQSGSALSLPEALGVVGVVLPDKDPLLSMVTLLGAAIATGNAIIMVPSQKYPLPALAFIQVSVKMVNVQQVGQRREKSCCTSQYKS